MSVRGPASPGPLIVTSSLRVADPGFLRPTGRHDEAMRRKDSLWAMHKWLKHQSTIRDFVFVDNSGASLEEFEPLSDLAARYGKTVEIHSFRTVDYSATRGRSFGELDIMRYALEHSAALRHTDHFWKVSGRLWINNVARVVTSTAWPAHVVGRLSHNLTWLATTFVGFEKRFYLERVLPYALDNIDDSSRSNIEHVYAQAVLRGIAEGFRWYPFPREPDLRGIRGLDGGDYRRPTSRRLLIDLAMAAYHRAYDHTCCGGEEHPQNRWDRKVPDRFRA